MFDARPRRENQEDSAGEPQQRTCYVSAPSLHQRGSRRGGGRRGEGLGEKQRYAPKPNWNMRFESVVGSGYTLTLTLAFVFASRSMRTPPHFVLLLEDVECVCECPDADAVGGGRGRGAAPPLKKSARSSCWYCSMAISAARFGSGCVGAGRVTVTVWSAEVIWPAYELVEERLFENMVAGMELSRER